MKAHLNYHNNGLEVWSSIITTPVHTLSLPSAAVLDIAWSPVANKDAPLLCVATSTGTLEFYNISFDVASPTPIQIAAHRIAHADILVLDVVFRPTRPDIIGATLSNGDVVLCRSVPCPDTSDEHHRPWGQKCEVRGLTIFRHSLEPWTLAFSDDGQTVFSGGDDATVQCIEISDLLQDKNFWKPGHEADEAELPAPSWSDRRAHGAGVTALLPIADAEGRELVVTGSYDDHIRLLSTTGKGRREVLAELDLGGGVWRLELIKSSHERDEKTRGTGVSDGLAHTYTILASCMHAGTRVVVLSQKRSEIDTPQWEFQVQAQFTEHKSMNYGSAVQPLQPSLDPGDSVVGPAAGEQTIVSTSFYDKLLCLWNVDVY
ncbi:hypothetical protein B0A51_05452 [Rachicladosporium sp. CCFEE 5018]|nr:hypothetical protein B0A51_05452 [Rachicladosporium sp. CCFEE 5018]